MWKTIRVTALLLILLVVAVNAWRDQHQDWNRPVIVRLHPINADQQETTRRYIEQLSAEQFKNTAVPDSCCSPVPLAPSLCLFSARPSPAAVAAAGA